MCRTPPPNFSGSTPRNFWSYLGHKREVIVPGVLAESVETVAYSLISVVSLVGNFLIVLIVYKTPTLKKPVNMLKYVDRKHGHVTCSIQYSASLLNWPSCNAARALMMVSLVRLCASYTLSLQTLPRSCRFNAWF